MRRAIRQILHHFRGPPTKAKLTAVLCTLFLAFWYLETYSSCVGMAAHLVHKRDVQVEVLLRSEEDASVFHGAVNGIGLEGTAAPSLLIQSF